MFSIRILCIGLCIGLLIVSFHATGQDVFKDFKKARIVYAKHVSFSIQVVKRVLLDQNHELVEETVTKMDVNKHQYRKESENEFIVCDGKKQLILNKPYKSFLLQNIQLNDKKKNITNNFPLKGMDTIIKLASNTKFSESENVKKYELTYKKGPFRTITFSFNKKTNFINSVSYLMATGMKDKNGKNQKWRIEISFNNLRLSPKFRKESFSLSPYIINNKGRYILTLPYKEYKLIQ